MPTQHPDIFAALASPFEPHEVKVRSAPGGRQMHYITARTAMNRLDDVVGPENWWDSFQVGGEHSVLCRLTIRIPDGDGWREITKEDAGGYAGMADQGDDDKSGYSDSFKRAAAKFGVARYLYRDGVPSFARDPGHVLPEPPPQARQPDRQDRPQAPQGGGTGYPKKDYGPPKTGKQLFAWAKSQEDKGHKGLVNWMNNWAKGQGFPFKMVDWDETQVIEAHVEAENKLAQREAREPGQD